MALAEVDIEAARAWVFRALWIGSGTETTAEERSQLVQSWKTEAKPKDSPPSGSFKPLPLVNRILSKPLRAVGGGVAAGVEAPGTCLLCPEVTEDS